MKLKEKLEKLRKKQGDIQEQMRSLVEKSLDDNDVISKEDREKLEEMKTQERSIKDSIKDVEDLVKREQELDAPQSQQERAQPDSQIGQPARPRVDVTRPDPKDEQPFAEFGEQLRAIAVACRSNNQIVDDRLRKVEKRAEQLRAASGYNESVPAEGGFLLQQDFSTELIKMSHETGILAKYCRSLTISTNANSIVIPGVDETSRANGSRWGGISMKWENEADALTTSKATFRKIRLELKKIIGGAMATEEILADTSVLGQFIMQGFAEELGFMVDDFIIRGSGSDQPLGILNAPAMHQVAKEAGPQAADTFVYQNAVQMRARFPFRSRSRGLWLMNQELETQLPLMNLAVGSGGSAVYLPAGGASEKPYDRLFGMPILLIEQASALGDFGDVMLVDLGYYQLADKGAPKTSSSIHVRFLNDEQTFKMTYRTDGKPVIEAPMTPYKASAGFKLSPFLALEAR